MGKLAKISKAAKKFKFAQEHGKRPLTELTGMVGPRILEKTEARNKKAKKKNDKNVRSTKWSRIR